MSFIMQNAAPASSPKEKVGAAYVICEEKSSGNAHAISYVILDLIRGNVEHKSKFQADDAFGFTQDAFVGEDMPFDYLELRVLEED